MAESWLSEPCEEVVSPFLRDLENEMLRTEYFLFSVGEPCPLIPG